MEQPWMDDRFEACHWLLLKPGRPGAGRHADGVPGLAGANPGELALLDVNRAARLSMVDFAPTRAAADRALAEIVAAPLGRSHGSSR
jgi:hypothetical protein